MPGFLGLAVSGRSPRELRRLGIAFVSLLVGVALVTGTSAAMDAITVALKESIAYTIPVDFVGSEQDDDALTEEGHAEQVAAEIRSAGVVDDAQPMVMFPPTHVLNADEDIAPFYDGSEAVLFLPESGSSVLEAYRIDGKVPENGTCALARQMATDLGVSVGDTVTLKFYVYEYSLEPATGSYESVSAEYTLDFGVSEIWTQEDGQEQVVYLEDGSSLSGGGFGPDSVIISQNVNPVVMNMADLTKLTARLPYGPLRDHYLEDSDSLYLMWVDRGTLIDTGGVEDDIAYLDDLRAELSELTSPYSLRVQRSDLAWALQSGATGLENYRAFILAFCAPAVAATFYLTSISANLYVESVRERLRNSGRKMISNPGGGAGVIAVVVGLGCSVAGAGLVLGYGSSMLLMDAVWHYTTWGAPAAAAANPAIGPLTVALALAIGVAGALLTYLLPMMRLLGGGESSERGRRRSRFLRNGMVEAYLIAAALLGIAIVISGFRFYMPEDSLRFQVTAEAVFKTTVLVLLAITPLAIAVGTVGLLTKSRLQLHSRIASLMTPRATSSAPSRRVQDLVFDGRRANAIAATTSLAIMTGVVASCGLVSYLAVTGRSTSDADYGGMRDMLAYTFFIATLCGIVVVGLLATEDSVRRRIQPDRPTAVPIAQADVRRAVVANSAASTTIGALVGVGAGLVGTLILATVMRYPEYEDPSLLYEPITMGFLEWVLPAVVIVIFGSAILAWVAVRPSDG